MPSGLRREVETSPSPLVTLLGAVAGTVVLAAILSCPRVKSDTDLELVCVEVRLELHKAHTTFLALPMNEQNARRAEHVRMLGEGLVALKSCPKEN